MEHRHRCNASALVQVKYTDDPERRIDEAAVREIVGAAARYPKYRNPQLVVITNARSFSDNAQKLALENNVALITRDWLGLWPKHILG